MKRKTWHETREYAITVVVIIAFIYLAPIVADWLFN